MRDERSAYVGEAQRVAAYLLQDEPRTFAPQRMSKYAHWFEDPGGTALVAVVTPGEKHNVGDEVLAYGLAWQQNRDLLLALPTNMVPDALTRLGWIATEVRIWEHDGNGTPHPVPRANRFQLLSHLRDQRQRQSKKAALKREHDGWLDGIDTEGLSAHARSYLSWHHDGLQVLKVSETRGGLRIQAGVQYSKPQPGREPFDQIFAAPPTPGDLAVINAKIDCARKDGKSQTSQMREHKMQAILINRPETLGLTRLWREFPAWRGLSGRPGYIDFLGVDAEGELHVVETKIGHDPKVVLQALDYAAWVKANEDAIRETLRDDLKSLPAPARRSESASSIAPIHLVLGASDAGPAFNGYLAAQIEALAGDCRVVIHLTAQPTAPDLELTTLSKAKMWEPSELVAPSVAGPRWAQTVTHALLAAER